MSQRSHVPIAKILTIDPVPRFWWFLRIAAAWCLLLTTLFAGDVLEYWSPGRSIGFFLLIFGSGGAGTAGVFLLWIETDKRRHPSGSQEMRPPNSDFQRSLRAVMLALFGIMGLIGGLLPFQWMISSISSWHLLVLLSLVGGTMFGCYVWLQVEKAREPAR